MSRASDRQPDISPDPASGVPTPDTQAGARVPRPHLQLPCQPATAAAPADPPFVTVIIPCRNEREYIVRALDSISHAEYPSRRLEVLVVDGMSDDGTAELVREYARRHANVRVVENPSRTVPPGLNAGITEARGDVIMRMDAHVEYPPEYVPRLVRWLEETGAENVGAACVTRPGASTPMARAIAAALSHPLGVGGSRFRLGTRRLRDVDTVPFGCFPRRVFDRFGRFDEELTRNQDDEFNHRIVRGGGRVLLVPDVVSYYYARPTLHQLARMFFQYGVFKPLAARKVGRITTLRQLAPPTAVGAAVALGLCGIWSEGARIGWLAGAAAYGVLVAAAAGAVGRRAGGAVALRLLVAFPGIHASYGLGYWLGLLRLAFRRRPRKAQDLPLSR